MAEETLNWLENLKDMNKELEERILEANEDESLLKWSKLLPDLMTADILMLGQHTGVKNEDGLDTTGIVILQKDGTMFIPFFTNPERIKTIASSEKNQFEVFRLNTARFFKTIRGKSATLNPFSPYTRKFSPFDVMVLSEEYIDKAPPIEKKVGKKASDEEE